jgi:hypothetical protein
MGLLAAMGLLYISAVGETANCDFQTHFSKLAPDTFASGGHGKGEPMKTTVKTSTKDVVLNHSTAQGHITLTLVDADNSSTVVLTADQVGAIIFGLEMAHEATQGAMA